MIQPTGGDNGSGNGDGGEKLEEGAATPFDRVREHGLIDPHAVLNKEFVFPGLEGLPFRGSVPTIKEDDPPEKRPQMGTQAFVKILELDKEEDLQTYVDIAQLVANGVAQISFEDKRWIEEKQNWKVLIRFMLVFYHMPAGAQTGV
jgi:hypothetical protein